MQVRTPGRRGWESKYTIRISTALAIGLLAGAMWFLYGRVKLLEEPHNPHFEAGYCFDCHQAKGSKMKAKDCFLCHNLLTRELLPNAVADREKLVGSKKCSHPLKTLVSSGNLVTNLCMGCHHKTLGYVAMVDINSKEYVEIDMNLTHPVGLMPTTTIYPKTLPLDRKTGAINCITCHDQHATDRRLRTLRYYYPGNGRPADFRPLCLDCHIDGWLPLSKLKAGAVREAKRHD